MPGTSVSASTVLAVYPPGPDHAKVAPGVVEPPCRSITGVKQLMISPGLAVRPTGTLTFFVTDPGSVAKHPLVGSVTVTVYVPPTLTVAVAPMAETMPGPAQLYVTPVVVELPVSRIVGWAQVTWAVAGMAEVATPCGTVVFWVTTELAAAVQPLVGSVAVRV